MTVNEKNEKKNEWKMMCMCYISHRLSLSISYRPHPLYLFYRLSLSLSSLSHQLINPSYPADPISCLRDLSSPAPRHLFSFSRRIFFSFSFSSDSASGICTCNLPVFFPPSSHLPPSVLFLMLLCCLPSHRYRRYSVLSCEERCSS